MASFTSNAEQGIKLRQMKHGATEAGLSKCKIPVHVYIGRMSTAENGDTNTSFGQTLRNAIPPHEPLLQNRASKQQFERDCLGNSVSMHVPVETIDSWSRGVRLRLLEDSNLECFHQTLSLERKKRQQLTGHEVQFASTSFRVGSWDRSGPASSAGALPESRALGRGDDGETSDFWMVKTDCRLLCIYQLIKP
ncbi:unnamed protein product [Protopolystoma xenopodis]|uniref:Uncharacterized protein n=1 Tax=Protopolystoma xenopodis TaxID=117903 RepID=A0A3S5CMN4_9PLAT|nr:unnamed protein product [Protopolystoma xenopodis]